MKTVFGPIGDSDVISLTASSQAFALGTLPTDNPAIRLIALNAQQMAWYVKFGASGAVTVSRTDGMRIIPGSQTEPVIIPVPSGSTHVAILAEGPNGDALLSYGGYDNGEFQPAGASTAIAVTSTDQRVALPALASSQPAIRLVSTSQAIQALWIKLGDNSVVGDMSSSMKVFPGSVENPTLVPVTNGETHLSIFCEGIGGTEMLTPGGIANGIVFPPATPTPMTVGRRDIADITAGDTAGTADRATLIDIASGTGTLAFTAAATLTAGWFCYIKNSGAGDVTLNPNGAETIDGLASWILYPGGCILVQCNGTNFESILLSPMRKVFTANGTLTKPGVGTWADIEGWASGGAGARSGANGGGGGGAGGQYKAVRLPLSALGTTETVTIGATVAGHTTGTTGAGSNGNNTTLGSLFTAFPGGGGGSTGSPARGGGGGGGGGLAAGGQGTGTGANGGGPDGAGGGGDNSPGNSKDGQGGGGGGGAGAANAAGSGGATNEGGAGGGGGSSGAGNGGAGGSSIKGGGGGGGASNSGTAGAAGTSIYGGNGGIGATGAADAGDGVAPGGGGGGSESGTSGDGARGELRVVIS